jgi:hypothetical protein
MIAQPQSQLCSRIDAELVVDVLDVVVDGAFRVEEICSYLPIGHALSHQLGDLQLLLGKRIGQAQTPFRV